MKKISNIAIIPARIGSKRIKEKNIKNFFGKPIIYLKIKKLKESKFFDKIYVTTDSKKIVKVLKKINFNNIILRDQSLSNDNVGTEPVIVDAIKKIKLSKKYINVCCVYPCNPFLSVLDLQIAFSKLKRNKDSLIFPVVEYSHPIERAYEFRNKNFIKRVSGVKKNERTQDYKQKFFDAGKFYLASKDTWIKNRSKKKIGIITKWWNGVDIDTPEDWEKAKTIFKIFKAN